MFTWEHRNWEAVELDGKRLDQLEGAVLATESREGQPPDKGRALLSMKFTHGVWGTQFHPEADKPGVMAWIEKPEHKVAVTDAYGNAIPDAPTVIAVSAGTVSPTRVMTDQHGQATTRWILGSKPGEQTINVSVRGTTVKTTFTVRATTGATRAR